uniref:5-aminolevulinate synthase presequence domain-containing protein n=1 Tax=Monodelphis domestica TaxID=13616 RepID=A0A5F8HLC8_MONDO
MFYFIHLKTIFWPSQTRNQSCDFNPSRSRSFWASLPPPLPPQNPDQDFVLFPKIKTVVRCCLFLSRAVPQIFLQKGGKSLLFCAQNCSKMMEVESKPASQAMTTSLTNFQQVKETLPATEKDKTSKAVIQPANDSQQATGRFQGPSGYPSKCSFLGAEMNQGTCNIFHKASLELQEDAQEMQAIRKEVAQTPINTSMINLKTGREDQDGLLRNLQNFLQKQRPQRASHLLQDNLSWRLISCQSKENSFWNMTGKQLKARANC